jgi:acetyl esterase/lipase
MSLSGWTVLLGSLLFVSLGSFGVAQEGKKMLLWPEGAPGALGEEEKDRPGVTVTRPPEEAGTDVAVVVCPGGGYGGLALGHEGVDIAQWWKRLGVTSIVLEYRHRGKGYGHPTPLQDVQRAIRWTRHRAEDWGIAPEKIGVMGFSAGGHLASSVGTHFDSGDPRAEDPIDRESCRPDFLILCYPVIAFGEPYTHTGSQRNLLGADPPESLVLEMSSEKQVREDTPPTFLFHTDQDEVVPPENSVAFYMALRRANVPAELHIFREGRHGIGLARDIPGNRRWPDLCRAWLVQMEFLPESSLR